MVKIVLKGGMNRTPQGPSNPVWAKSLPQRVADRDAKSSQQQIDRAASFDARMRREAEREAINLTRFKARMNRQQVSDQYQFDLRLVNLRKRLHAQEYKEDIRANTEKLKLEERGETMLKKRRERGVMERLRDHDREQKRMADMQRRFDNINWNKIKETASRRAAEASSHRPSAWGGGSVPGAGDVRRAVGPGPWGPRGGAGGGGGTDWSSIAEGAAMVFGKVLGPALLLEMGKELGKTLLNPAAITSSVYEQMLSSGKRFQDFQDTGYNLARAGGFSGRAAMDNLFAGNSLRGGLRATGGNPWMDATGLSAEGAMGMLGRYGIPNPNQTGLLASLRWAQMSPGFSTLDPNAPIGAARQGEGLGMFGPNGGSPSRYLQSLSGVLEDGTRKGMDASRLLESIQSSLGQMEKAGATGISSEAILKLVDTMMNSGMAGGRTGTAAMQALGGYQAAIGAIGSEDATTVLTYRLLDKYKVKDEDSLRKFIGEEAWKKASGNAVGQNDIKMTLQALGKGDTAFALPYIRGLLQNDPTRMQSLGAEAVQGMFPGQEYKTNAAVAAFVKNSVEGSFAASGVGSAQLPGSSAGTVEGWVQSMIERVWPGSKKGGLSAADNAFLDIIAGPESTGHANVRFGGKAPKYFDTSGGHPRILETIPEGMPMAGAKSDAAGEFQMISTTWDRARGLAGGLPDVMSEDNQRKAAFALIKDKYKGDLEGDLNSGDPQKLRAIAGAIRGEWATAPGAVEDAIRRNGGLGTPSAAYMENLPANLPDRAVTENEGLMSSANNFKEFSSHVHDANDALAEFSKNLRGVFGNIANNGPAPQRQFETEMRNLFAKHLNSPAVP